MRQSETFYGMLQTQSVGFEQKHNTIIRTAKRCIGNGEVPGKFCLNFDPSIILQVSQLQWRWTCDMYQGVQELWKLETCTCALSLFCMVVCFWKIRGTSQYQPISPLCLNILSMVVPWRAFLEPTVQNQRGHKVWPANTFHQSLGMYLHDDSLKSSTCNEHVNRSNMKNVGQ